MKKETTKVRLVFNAASTCNGVALNEYIHPGPKLPNEMSEILIGLRRFQIALVCDIFASKKEFSYNILTVPLSSIVFSTLLFKMINGYTACL